MANILVVDDEEQVRRLLNRTLSGTGIHLYPGCWWGRGSKMPL